MISTSDGLVFNSEHEFESHLFTNKMNQADTTKMNWNSLSSEEQAHILQSSHELKEGPELNKYDESLSAHGSVILPSKKVFGPDEWQDKSFSPDIERYDLPDGRVILRKSGIPMAMNTEGLRRSENMEDVRTQADKWGDSFGPSEGGPPAGIDPNTWYNDSLLKILDPKTKVDAAQQIQRDITDKFGRTADPSVLNSAEDVDKVPPYIQEKEREDDPGAGEEPNPMN